MVERFDIGEECSGIGCWMEMVLRPEGNYVTYADYAKLQAKADALEAVMREIATYCPWLETRENALAALAQHGKDKPK